MKNEKYDWTQFVLKTNIQNASVNEIFRMCSTSGGLTEWFIRKSEFKNQNGILKDENDTCKKGDNFKWIFNTGNTVEGEIKDIKENELVKFTFGENNPNSIDNVLVSFNITEQNGAVEFKIIQDNMIDNEWGRFYSYISCNMGWTFFLYNLKSIFENNHDLRVKSRTRLDVDAPSRYGLENYYWTSFTFKEYIKKTRKKVFEMWITSKNLRKWWVKDATFASPSQKANEKKEFISKNDNYWFSFYSGVEMTGKILEYVENELIKFTFGKKEPDSDEDVIVTITFHDDEEDYTRIEVLQENIVDNDYGHVNYNMKCIIAWSHYLTNLRSILESGFDFRDKN